MRQVDQLSQHTSTSQGYGLASKMLSILSVNIETSMTRLGTFPDINYSTWSPQFLEISSNVFNVNNDLTGFNKDVVRSLVQDPSRYNPVGFYSKDTTNFVLAIPTSTDNTFQQGQTANTTINYQLQFQLDTNSPFKSKAT